MKGADLIEYIKQRPQLLCGDVKHTIMALLHDRRINPSELIDAQYALKDEECRRYRLHWQEANVAANMMMNSDKEMQRRGRIRAMYNSLADKTMVYDAAYSKKLSDKDMEECRKFFKLHYGFNGEE